ncbi:class I SAM-dependent methyltransferase [Streptomyces acidicola]|uniref:class I SAM-dependent methyltransferase n=1 Tax=Streptomyces acidicola TaxID=2596892 RepID=UPI0037977156
MTASTEPDAPDAPSYVFDNDDPEAADRHGYLAEILDGQTVQRLSGLGDLTGRRCLEIGAGGGSIAHWLAHAAGPAGRVLATDINTRYLSPDADFDVLRHDLVSEPVPEGPWDVIHARLVLLHLPQRREILHRLTAALAPGGALVLEDFETTFRKSVLAAPTPECAELVDTYHRVLVEHVLPAHGNDPTWAGQVYAAMLAEGMTELDTVVYARSWPGGTAGALLIAANIAQAREGFLAAGMSDAQLDELQRLASDPRLVVRGPLTYSTIGRRPAEHP